MGKLLSEIEGNHSVILGKCLEEIGKFESQQFQTCVTSPPYWGLRDYEMDGRIGAESSLEDYVTRMVAVFREVKRVLRIDGTLWLNIGEEYTSGGRTWRDTDKKILQERCLIDRPRLMVSNLKT